jgi:hypothetical protein
MSPTQGKWKVKSIFARFDYASFFSSRKVIMVESIRNNKLAVDPCRLFPKISSRFWKIYRMVDRNGGLVFKGRRSGEIEASPATVDYKEQKTTRRPQSRYLQSIIN